MKVDLEAHNWRILRALLRGGTLTGAELRKFYWSRKSKDGKFLDLLVARGHIQAVHVREPASTKPSDERQPVQLRTEYTITEVGREVAEYGEFTRTPPAKVEKKTPKKGRSRK